MSIPIITKERLSKQFDDVVQTIVNDKERIIETMLDRCMSAEISIPFNPGEVPCYTIYFTHSADMKYD